MLSDGVILLHDNTHTARKTQELLRKFKWEVWSHTPNSRVWVPNTYLEQSSLQTNQGPCPLVTVENVEPAEPPDSTTTAEEECATPPARQRH
ncbi:hypothetical protein AVEN_33003-1 [Araneus ventricosus]|uniref:Uncharacterized protein n=1 Tax=Araneus ventricosus TaxID=182803 RepID=A0A4Y2N0U9_ARAVE|nr:hypothetical protein AVEN_33003-1 [Araneus ventricosus]